MHQDVELSQGTPMWVWGAVGVILGWVSTAAPAWGAERFEFQRIAMAVDVKLIVYAADAQAANTAAEAAYARIEALNAALSDYDPRSELSRLSETAGSGQAVEVSDDLWRVLAAAQEISSRSDGAFDVTIGPAVQLWRRARRQRQLPTPERVAQARAAIGYRHLLLDAARRTALVERPGMRLDLGGIAKGFAADEALVVLREHGCPAALVGLAGDIAAGDPPPGEPGWTVAIESPAAPQQASGARRLRLCRQAVSTSGDTSQYVEIDGVRYSHLVDPKTGLGMTRRGSVTIVAPTGMLADAYASAVCLLGLEAGLRLVKETPGMAAAFYVLDEAGNLSVRETAGMARLWLPAVE